VKGVRLKLVSRDAAEEERLRVQQEKAVQREIWRKAQEEGEKVAKAEKVKALKKVEKENRVNILKERREERGIRSQGTRKS
jgi:hypothetical protein